METKEGPAILFSGRPSSQPFTSSVSNWSRVRLLSRSSSSIIPRRFQPRTKTVSLWRRQLYFIREALLIHLGHYKQARCQKSPRKGKYPGNHFASPFTWLVKQGVAL